MKGHWVGVVDARIANRLEDEVARLEGEKANAESLLGQTTEAMEQFAAERDTAEAANAALTAALEATQRFLEQEEAEWGLRPPRNLKPAVDVAFSDTGKGWLEVREQARLAIGHAFHLIEHNKAMCVRCREAEQRLRAALVALGGK